MTRNNKQNNGTHTVTLKDIAEKTGYSVNTVSRALSDKSDISDATKQLIRQTADELGYIGNALASFLRSGVTKNISIIVGDISNPHFSVMVKEMQMLLSRNGFNTIIFNTDEDSDTELSAVRISISQNVDGVIICPAPADNKAIEMLESYGKPYVLIGRHIDEDTDYVICDDKHSGYIAAKHLLEKGHRKILFLNGPPEISSAVERLEGYIKAFKEYGITPDMTFVKTVDITAGRNIDRMKEVILQTKGYTAILAFSDILAWQAISILEERGIKVPEEVSVVGFDNIKFPFPVGLTTVTSSKTTMAKTCVDILLGKLDGKSEKCQIILETELIERDTVRSVENI